jgi:VIT1/CCC1 family predicted Fe2+/Mn2+ transporter
MSRDNLRMILTNLREERQASYLYRHLEAVEPGPVGSLFAGLRAESEEQAKTWERLLDEAGAPAPRWRPGPRARIVAWLIGRIGPTRMLPVLSAMKVRGLGVYRADSLATGAAGGAAGDPEAVAVPRPGRTVQGGTDPTAAAPAVRMPRPPRAIGEESWHRAASGGGALRAAVFGVNDGLVSNASLIIGVAGAGPDPGVILLAGTAGLLAGGFSMAAGEFISVLTQREFLEHQIALEKSEMAVMPEEEIAELALIYRAKGIDPDHAEALARRIVSDPEKGLDTLAREELGLDPKALGSPLAAAAASFVSFAGGALLPLLPYLLAPDRSAFAATLGVTCSGLLAVGAGMSLFTGRRPVWSAVRMALIGAAAAAATYAIGALLGVAVT